MCRYVKGQKIELWRIESGDHPHRVVEQVVVTVTGFSGQDNHGDGHKLLAVDSIGQQFEKNRPTFSPQNFLEIVDVWTRVDSPQELWREAVLAATYAYHNQHRFKYSNGHDHEVKPSGGAVYCKQHHIWQHAGWPCPERGRKAKIELAEGELIHADA